ncbi:allergen Tha p 1-like [Bicyclus anynana]|uniref:Allergen Tha p 1-like n=1 Tax=Bicyclus anynana TaxID=110368 RepID=A0ABM3LXW7_BICAN|nr:allergen Tha p 1-like [Bicyclus anynana]
MRFLLLFIVFVIADEVYYDNRYNYFDIDHFVHNTRLLRKYIDCFLSKGPCTPIGKAFKAHVLRMAPTLSTTQKIGVALALFVVLPPKKRKRRYWVKKWLQKRIIIPEVIRTACVKCSPSQKRLARRTFEAFRKHVPDGYAELRQRLDPQNKYYARFELAVSRA